jgi:cysteine desulfurase/selenocysteine lyase
MLAIQEIRARFPFLADSVYLNTAAVGLTPSPPETLTVACGPAVSRGSLGRDERIASLTRTKVQLGDLLGVHVDRISFTGSTTEALNLAALGLPLGAGNRVVLAADEFPSVVQPWFALRHKNIEIKRVEIPRESDRTDLLASAVAEGAHVLAVSHVHWRTGTAVNLEKLSAVCRKHRTWLIVDGVQAVGVIPVRAGLADAYCASSFKWLLADFGLGFMTLGEELASQWTPPLRGYGNEWPSRDPQYSHANHPGVCALTASLEFMGSLGWNHIYSRVGHLVDRLRAVLRERGFDTVAPSEASAGIVSVRRNDATELVRSLARESIFVEDREGVVRASPHFYNTDGDVDRFAAALAQFSLSNY